MRVLIVKESIYNKAPHLPLYNPDILGSLLKQASLFWLLASGFWIPPSARRHCRQGGFLLSPDKKMNGGR